MQASEKKIRPLSKQELKNLYGIPYRTLRLWLKPFQDKIGAYQGGKYTVKQVNIIFESLGEPDNF